MGRWLGHRDLCPSQWGKPCDCPCSDEDCPGHDRCKGCSPIEGGSLWTEESIQAARKHRTEDQAEDAKYDAESSWSGDAREVW